MWNGNDQEGVLCSETSNGRLDVSFCCNTKSPGYDRVLADKEARRQQASLVSGCSFQSTVAMVISPWQSAVQLDCH